MQRSTYIFFLFFFLARHIAIGQATDSTFNSIIDGVYINEHIASKSASCHFMPYTETQWRLNDTLWHPNGRIASITTRNHLGERSGPYLEFDEYGVLITEGEYSALDSATCLNCFEGSHGARGDTGTWRRIDKIAVGNLQTGTWKTYHPNGVLASAGCYDTLFTIHYGAGNPDDWDRPINVYRSLTQLKKGIWFYYDADGKLMYREEYHHGALVFVSEFYE